MKKTKEQYQREFATHFEWDQSDPKNLTPHVDINRTKINHVIKRYLMEHHDDVRLVSATSETLYNVLKRHPLANIAEFLFDYVSYDDLVACVEKGLQSYKGYSLITTDSKEFIKRGKEIGKKCEELNKKPLHSSIKKGEPLMVPEGGSLTAIDTLLKSEKLPDLGSLITVLNSNAGVHDEQEGAIDFLKKETKGHLVKIKGLEKEVTALSASALSTLGKAVKIKADGPIPEGTYTTKKASEIFDMKLKADLDVPVWEWEGEHPFVPEIDPHYIFREKELTRVLYAIVSNQRAYLHGHTGCGKTTLIEQVAARLQYPFGRVNFDSEITRMDLIGRDTLLRNGDGTTSSQFVDGILPTLLKGPFLSCFDEIDFVRPDVAYVMQSVLEGNGLRITEDGDRTVLPHEMFRMFATGNTVGQGDENGMYQGARPQSNAFLDRFTIWTHVEYLEEKDRKTLVDRHYPHLKDEHKKVLAQYVKEHLEAFKQEQVHQAISPRGMLAIAHAAIVFGDIKEALSMTILDRANSDNYATFKGIIDRVTK